jgi:hypothetical protein
VKRLALALAFMSVLGTGVAAASTNHITACQRAQRTFKFETWDTKTDKARAQEIVSAVCYH